ncbi:ribonuclease P protein component [Alteromonas aestuariivivens]|uniref:Ribonuclease P protein component n=1 Tax=Alteromonas aestuariivivens TaxID=1938339 RepID=A0A3D8M4X1_9ALTE|nr:ribonuclease P protein component [Alteromonas aestuariivivens]RDV24783.1 ribonuclease P protein component [Alteromonas aestuariivivens]
MGENQFSRELRLLTPSHFTYVFNDAIPAVSSSFTLLARHNQSKAPRLGITLAKKRIRKAHERNRLKRLIRESFRHQAKHLPNIDIIVIGKSGADQLTNEEVFTTLDKLWKKLARRCEK